MVFIFFSTVFWYLFFQSMGNTLLRFLRVEEENPFLTVWLGFFFSAFLALFLSLWMPLDDPLARLTIGAAACPGVLPTIRAWRAIFAGRERRIFFICSGCIFFLLLLQAFTSCFEKIPYDTDLYHQQTVLWLKEYGIVPGLGNLHCRLAQVSGWLALAAIVDWGPFQARAAFIMPPLCLLSALMYFSFGACHSRTLAQRLYLLILLVIGCLYVSDFISPHLIMIGSPSIYYDRPALIIYSIFVSELLPVFFEKGCNASLMRRLKIVSVLICASILMKPISIPAVIFYIIFLGINFYHKKLNFYELFCVLWIPAVVSVLWLTLNIFLSGYPLFPFTFLSMPFDWTMRLQDVDYMRRGVQGFARWPGAELNKALDAGVAYWFFPWLKRNLKYYTFVWGLCTPLVLGTFLWGVAFWKKGQRNGKIFFGSLAFSHLVYWFFQHPSLRFGLEFFWSWLALGAVFSIPKERMIRIQWFRDTFFLLLLMLCIAGVQSVRRLVPLMRDSHVLQGLVLPQRHTAYLHVRPHTLHQGSPEEFIIYTSSPKHELCGNSPLPCTTRLDDGLYMRKSGDLGAGFTFRKD